MKKKKEIKTEILQIVLHFENRPERDGIEERY